jgi:hypothetical protein
MVASGGLLVAAPRLVHAHLRRGWWGHAGATRARPKNQQDLLCSATSAPLRDLCVESGRRTTKDGTALPGIAFQADGRGIFEPKSALKFWRANDGGVRISVIPRRMPDHF